jgi:hypothetical protein
VSESSMLTALSNVPGRQYDLFRALTHETLVGGSDRSKISPKAWNWIIGQL